MDPDTRVRLFGYEHAFDHPVTVGMVIGIAALLATFVPAIWSLWRVGCMGREQYEEMKLRWRSWLWLAALILAPILLGAAWAIGAVAALSLLSYREFARATGLFREKTICSAVVVGIGVVTFAVADHYTRLFFAAASLTVCCIAIATIFADRPQGYVQRVGLGVVGFLLFGYCLGYLGCFANASNFRPVLLMILLGVELNDSLAYCVGKAVGGPKLAPNTSPGKTVSGSIGALVLTTALVAGLAHAIFIGTAVDRIDRLLTLGFMIAALGQLGDLMLSSIKRDIGVKDMGVSIPGHGGVLDRFDSLVLVPPAVFHYLSLHLGPIGCDQAARIITGG